MHNISLSISLGCVSGLGSWDRLSRVALGLPEVEGPASVVTGGGTCPAAGAGQKGGQKPPSFFFFFSVLYCFLSFLTWQLASPREISDDEAPLPFCDFYSEAIPVTYHCLCWSALIWDYTGVRLPGGDKHGGPSRSWREQRPSSPTLLFLDEEDEMLKWAGIFLRAAQ